MQDLEQVVHEERQPVPGWAALVVLVSCLGSLAVVAVLVAANPETRTVGYIVCPFVLLVDGLLLVPMLGGLRVRVTNRTLRVRLGVFGAGWDVGEIVSCQPVTYDPLRQFGGWGFKPGLRVGVRAYTGRGDRRALLTLASDQRVLVGSDGPESFCSALGAVGVAVGPALTELV